MKISEMINTESKKKMINMYVRYVILFVIVSAPLKEFPTIHCIVCWCQAQKLYNFSLDNSNINIMNNSVLTAFNPLFFCSSSN